MDMRLNAKERSDRRKLIAQFTPIWQKIIKNSVAILDEDGNYKVRVDNSDLKLKDIIILKRVNRIQRITKMFRDLLKPQKPIICKECRNKPECICEQS